MTQHFRPKEWRDDFVLQKYLAIPPGWDSEKGAEPLSSEWVTADLPRLRIKDSGFHEHWVGTIKPDAGRGKKQKRPAKFSEIPQEDDDGEGVCMPHLTSSADFPECFVLSSAEHQEARDAARAAREGKAAPDGRTIPTKAVAASMIHNHPILNTQFKFRSKVQPASPSVAKQV